MKNALLTLIVAALVGAAYFAFGRFAGEDVPPLTVSGPPIATSSTPDAVTLAADETVPARERVPEPAPVVAPQLVEASAAEEQREPWIARGRVLDIEGEPVLDVGVALNVRGPFGGRVPGAVMTRTIGDGSFEVTLRNDSAQLIAISEEWACVMAATAERRTGERELIIPVARRLDLTGRVVDGEGNGLSGAIVSVDVAGMLLLRSFPLPLDSASRLRWNTKSAADGSFALAAVPALEDGRLSATLKGYESHVRELPEASTRGLVLRLAPESETLVAGAGEKLVSGVVVLESGAPVQGATVKVFDVETETDGVGRFQLAVSANAPENVPIVAAKRGLRPAIVAGFGARLRGEEPIPPLYLVLGDEALSIHGRVLWADDKPAKGWSVGLLDPTVIDPYRIPSKTAEDLAGPKKQRAKTGKAGDFTLGGLSERTYRIRAYDSRTLLAIESDAVQAGEQELVLRVPEDAFHERLEGRVLAHDGVPLADVHVGANLVTSRTPSGFTSIGGPSGRTDEDGVFVIEQVPRRHVYLTASGDDVLSESLDLDESTPSKGIEILLYRRCHMRFEWQGTEPPPTAMGVLDAAGEALSLVIRTKQSMMSMSREDLEDGRSRVVSVSEAAATLVLYRDGEELERIPLTLAPGEVNVIRR